MLRFKSRFIIVSVSTLFAQAAVADVTFYSLFKTSIYTQTSSVAPTTADSWDFSARIFTDTDDDVTGATLNYGSSSASLTAIDPRQVGFFDYGYATEADLDAAYPAGDYDFVIDSGNLATFGQTVSLPDAVRPNEVPFLSGSSFDSLANSVAGSAVGVSWNAFTVPSAVDFETIYFLLVDKTDNIVRYANNGVNGAYLSDTIPGSALIANHDYQWTLYYDPRLSQSGVGPNNASFGDFGFDALTVGTFRVQAVPEPAAFAALGLGMVGILARRKRSV